MGFWQVVSAGVDLVDRKEPWACSSCNEANVGQVSAGAGAGLPNLRRKLVHKPQGQGQGNTGDAT